MTPELAIADNVALYAAIFRAHGREGRLDEHYWSTDAEPPPYYSRLVTTSRGSEAHEVQLQRLRELAERAQGESWGCKDSFDELPDASMRALGLRLLFRASWYHWDASSRSREPQGDLQAQRVTTPAELATWENAWRQSSPAGVERVFPDTLLKEVNLELHALSLRGQLVGGFILNRCDTVIGLSNVFRTDECEISAGKFFGEWALVAADVYPEHSVVGYEKESNLDTLIQLGAVPLARLAVWVSQ